MVGTELFCRYAVVTGSNKGIGFEICKQLASTGVTVVLTARDEKRGLQAAGELRKNASLSGGAVIFHQLDVADPASVAALVGFVATQFGRLDILVIELILSSYPLFLIFEILWEDSYFSHPEVQLALDNIDHLQVNNAGISGHIMDRNALSKAVELAGGDFVSPASKFLFI